jgi:hypothetical protein
MLGGFWWHGAYAKFCEILSIDSKVIEGDKQADMLLRYAYLFL